MTEKRQEMPTLTMEEIIEKLGAVTTEPGPTKPAGRERPRLSREEILERKVNMAKERGSRVLKINSPLGLTMFNVLRQFDQAYSNFKGQLGEPGGISHEDGAKLMEEVRGIVEDFSRFTGKLSKKVNFTYRKPQELKNLSQDKTEVEPEKLKN